MTERQLYQNNADFKEYVDKYCKTLRHNCTVEEALTHITVKNFAEYIRKGINNDKSSQA